MPTEPQRIVVLAGDQLDALCALGLQSRIVAAALPDGSDAQPSYLGGAVHDLPAVGTRSSPDLDKIRAARPDLILGSDGLTPDAYPELSAIAPTVFTDAPGADWEDNLRTVGAATGRVDATNRMIDDFTAAADRTGTENDAAPFPGFGRSVHRQVVAGIRSRQFPRQRSRRCRRGTACGTTLYRQALRRGRYHRRGSRQLPRLLARRRRHHLRLLRITCGQGSRERGDEQRCVEGICPRPGTTGCSSSTTRCGRPARASSPRGAMLADLRWINAPIN